MQGVLNVTNCLFLTTMRFAKKFISEVIRRKVLMGLICVPIVSYEPNDSQRLDECSNISDIIAALSGMHNHVFLNIMLL
jgi:hypothetical protein